MKRNCEFFKKCGGIVCIMLMLLCVMIAINIHPAYLDLKADYGTGLLRLINMLRAEMLTVTFEKCLALVAVLILWKKTFLLKRYPFLITAGIVGVLFSIFLVLGMSYSTFNSSAFIFSSKCQFIIAIITFIGFFAILYPCLSFFYLYLDSMSSPINHYSEPAWLKRNFKFISVMVIFLCWLPMLIVYFPGSMPYDGLRQVEMYLGFQQTTTHHPFFSTQLLGLLFEYGSKIFGNQCSSLLCIIVLCIFSILIYSSICFFIHDFSWIIALIALSFFSFVPAFPSYVQAVMKDGFYVSSFAWFILEFVKCWKNYPSKTKWFQLIISAIFVCLFRNNGIYIIIPSLLILIFLSPLTCRKKTFLSFLIVIMLNSSLLFYVNKKLEIPAGSKVEVYSICLQQVARYVSIYGDEISEEDANIINQIVVYDGLGERYDPVCSDPVKDMFQDSSKEDWAAFWKLWLKLFLTRPRVYIDATINHMFGYLYPFYFYDGLSQYPLYIQTSLNEADNFTNPNTYHFSDKVRGIMTSYIYLWNKLPLLSFLVNPAFYTWLGIVLLAAMIRKKHYKGVLFYIIPFLNVLICFVSPVNGYLRYMLPVIAAMPLFFHEGITNIAYDKFEGIETPTD